ncbi:MAG: ABC transporter ATP-binding protein [Bacillota bacterium]|jgi:ABC-2 type transport system ATP-binding protein|nr:ABC transporter ATP-binding protein [Candidatus Fermentithermobacillaceae bacterium]
MLLQVKGVSFSYGSVRALQDVSFCAQAGQIVGLIGENGAGKSTMIKNITRHLKPQQGQITIDGTRVSEISNEDFPVSYIPEIPVFYEELTVIEHLHFIKALYPENTQSIPAIVAHFELEEHINKVPSALSRGTKQKLMIAMALMRAYRILIADEPFTGLDPKQIRLLKETMLQHKKDNKLVLLSTHLLDMVEKLCDKYIILHKGRVLATGAQSELASYAGLPRDSSMENIYLKLVESL